MNKMKKLLLIALPALMLTACADKNQYQQAVLEQMQKEQDIKDYKLDPEQIARCVVDTSSSNMPGAFALDPTRMMAYRNYAKMLNVSKAQDPKKELEVLRNDFGSAKELSDAHNNYAESLVECYTSLISASDEKARPEQQ